MNTLIDTEDDDTCIVVDDLFYRGQTFVRIKVYRKTHGNGWLFDGNEAVACSIHNGDITDAFLRCQTEVALRFGVVVPDSANPQVLS